MGLLLRKDRNGRLIRRWYGEFWVDGVRRVRSLGIPIDGTPPASLLISDTGDAAYEASRTAATEALAIARDKGIPYRAKTAGEIYADVLRDVTGKRWRPTKIGDMVKAFEAEEEKDCRVERRRKRSEGVTSVKRTAVREFVSWWRDSGRSTRRSVEEITRDDVVEYLNFMSGEDDKGRRLKSDTISRKKTSLTWLLNRLLPSGAENPFSMIRVERQEGDNVIHRNAMSQEEVERLIRVARERDELAHDLIVGGISTAQRRGDVCNLKWNSVNFNANSIHIEIRKTHEEVDVPLFPIFREVLERRLSDRTGDLVFPEAEALYRLHPDSLTRRIKKLYVAAFGESHGILQPEDGGNVHSEVADVSLVVDSIEKSAMPTMRKRKVLKVVRLYGEGLGFKRIRKETGIPIGTISNYIHLAERLSGMKVQRSKGCLNGVGIDAAIRAVTQTERKVGRHRASVLDYHTLRTTFITLAIKAGIDPSTIAKVTGHTDIRIIDEYYNRVTGADRTRAFAAALPCSFSEQNSNGGAPADDVSLVPRGECWDESAVVNAVSKMPKGLRKSLMRALVEAD